MRLDLDSLHALRVSAVPPGTRRYVQDDLPAMPDAEFSILPPRPNETRLVGDVRRLLVEQFT